MLLITFQEITRLLCSVPNPCTPVGFSSGAEKYIIKDTINTYWMENLSQIVLIIWSDLLLQTLVYVCILNLMVLHCLYFDTQQL